MNRNILILTLSQALSMTAPPMVVLIGGIVGSGMASNRSLATLPLAMQVIGVALFSVPSALLMEKIGRRAGFILGSLLAIVSSIGAMYAISIHSFWFFCCSILGLGGNMSFVQQYRFAAAESVAPTHIGRAISIVLTGGIIAAFIGPELAQRTRDWLSYGPYSGSFATLTLLYVINIVLLSFLRLKQNTKKSLSTGARPLTEIVQQPIYRIAVIAGVVSYACMTFIMTATPVSMHVIDGFSLDDTAFVIQSHVLAMFVPSFFSGALIDRFGLSSIMITGCFLNILCGFIALYDQHLLHYWFSLVMLGVGWNFLFVGATTLLTQCYHENERFKAQALNDFTIFAFQAIASLSAGAIIYYAGWKTINLITLPLLFGMIFIIFRMPIRSR